MRKIAVLASVLFLVGCGPSKQEFNNLVVENSELKKSYDNLEISYQALLEENAHLEAERRSNAINPPKLEEDIKEHLKQNDQKSAYKKLAILQNEFPESSEAIRSRAIYKELEAKNSASQARIYADLVTHRDKTSGVVWYYHKDLMLLIDDTPVFAYIAEAPNGKKTLRYRVMQLASGIEKAEIDLIHKKYTINSGFKEVENRSYFDIKAEAKEQKMLSELASSNSAFVNFYGTKADSLVVTPKEKEMINAVLRAYKTL